MLRYRKWIAPFKPCSLIVLLLEWMVPSINLHASGQCTGHFINPITDVCWSCLFPLSIGRAKLVSGHNPDTENPSSPLQLCPMPIGWRIGLAIGYWEPFATTDVTQTPYCMVNLGGLALNITGDHHHGSSEQLSASGTQGVFYQVHWYTYPLMAWIKIITSIACLQGGDFDVGYLTELDPTWGDDALGYLLSPEVALFANPIAQMACGADALSASTGSARNELFWCQGAQGSSYPLTGSISAQYAPLSSALLLTERLDFKLHRLGLVEDSSGHNHAVCHTQYQVMLPKNRYRYELMNPVADSRHCHPFGRSVVGWQAGKLKLNDRRNYGFMLWRKRNCVVL